MKKFAILGVAGYVAPKHMEAIELNNGRIVAAFDPHDSVGILDSYAKDCCFFTDWERFDRHISKNPVDYIVICSPNYKHDSQCLWGLKTGANVICEKPLTVSLKNAKRLAEEEKKYKGNISAILQMRYISYLLNGYTVVPRNKLAVVYHSPRGNWYHNSWKGNEDKSGGLSMNIGIHLFDFLIFNFGRCSHFKVTERSNTKIKGYLNLNWADVYFEISIDSINEPKRLIRLNNKQIDFTNKFNHLHTQSYEQILKGRPFTIEETFSAIELTEQIRLNKQR